MEGLPEKRQKDPAHAEINFTHVFTAKNRSLHIDDAFNNEFEVEYVPSHGNKEIVFCHKPSGTLIQADLLFNLPASEQYSNTPEGAASATTGLPTRIFSSILTTKGAAKWHKRFLWYGIVQDKQDFAHSLRTILGWNWDRLIPCHGDVIETGGKGVLESIMEWQLKAGK